MGCCAKYAAKLILSLSALAFLALSVVLMYVSVSAFDSPFFEGVVAAVAVGGVVLSLLTAVVACTGCAALLSCKRPRTWLALYLLFDLLVAVNDVLATTPPAEAFAPASMELCSFLRCLYHHT